MVINGQQLILPPYVSNRNFITNAWFTVNQRNITITNPSINDRILVLDRWHFGCTNSDAIYSTLEVTSDGVCITPSDTGDFTNTQNEVFLWEKLENYDILLGKTLTHSIMLSDGTIHAYTFDNIIKTNYNKAFSVGKIRLSHGFDSRNGNCYCDTRYGDHEVNSNGDNITIRAMKLEIGPVSTLHLDGFPTYSNELMECQRFLYRLNGSNGNILLYTFADDTNHASITLQYPIEMASTPTLSANGSFQLNRGSTAIPLTNLFLLDTSKSRCTFSIYVNSNYPLYTGEYLPMSCNGDAYLELSCDI